MTEPLTRICQTREQAHDAARVIYALAQQLIADGERVRMTAGVDEEDITIKQRKFLHGPVLGQISEQVSVGGVKYTRDIWKAHLKDLFLPDEWEMRRALIRDPLTGELRAGKRKTPHRIRKSTEGLSITGYSELIDKVIAHAASEWGVQFRFDIDERDSVRYVAPKRKKQSAPQPEAVEA